SGGPRKIPRKTAAAGHVDGLSTHLGAPDRYESCREQKHHYLPHVPLLFENPRRYRPVGYSGRCGADKLSLGLFGLYVRHMAPRFLLAGAVAFAAPPAGGASQDVGVNWRP